MKKTIEVVAGLIQKDGKFLCCQRKDVGELAMKWEFPGGKIELGESHHEALKRELKEELNIITDVNDIFITVRHEYKTFILVMYVYNVEVIEGQIILNEHIDSKWLSPVNMLQYDFADADIPIIDKLLV